MPESDSSASAAHQQEPWFRLATHCAMEIRKRFGALDQPTEARMVRVFRSALRPRKRAGRRPNHVTVRAAEMWRAGMRERAAGGKRIPPRLYQRLLWQQPGHSTSLVIRRGGQKIRINTYRTDPTRVVFSLRVQK